MGDLIPEVNSPVSPALAEKRVFTILMTCRAGMKTIDWYLLDDCPNLSVLSAAEGYGIAGGGDQSKNEEARDSFA
jgi:hypothetical protein